MVRLSRKRWRRHCRARPDAGIYDVFLAAALERRPRLFRARAIGCPRVGEPTYLRYHFMPQPWCKPCEVTHSLTKSPTRGGRAGDGPAPAACPGPGWHVRPKQKRPRNREAVPNSQIAEAHPPQRFSASSTAAVKPRSENVSLVCVPREDLPTSVASAPRFIAAMILASSAVVAGHAHSPSVNSS